MDKQLVHCLYFFLAFIMSSYSHAASRPKLSKHEQSLLKIIDEKSAFLGKTAEAILSHVGKTNSQTVTECLCGQIQVKLFRKGELTETEAYIYAVDRLEKEVYNGGFDQYFVNPSGDLSVETLSILKEMGATATAAILEKAMAPFPKGKPPEDGGKRWAAMEKIRKKAKPIWDKCDDEFYSRKEDLPKLLLDYAVKKKADIRLP